MNLKAIVNGKIVRPTGILEDAVLVVSQGVISGIFDDVPAGAQVIDAGGLFVAPGFVDVHIHGSMGHDVMDQDEAGLKAIAKGIAANGTTSFLPTTLTMDRTDVYGALENIRKLKDEAIEGAHILGAHLEGPFINVKYKGAQNPAFIVPPDFSWIEDFKDVVKLVTYAPEMDEGFAFTKEVKEKTDVTLSMGHTDATYKQACAAIDCGCSHVTHLFNAMTPLHHRDPGVVGAALMKDVYTEFIADTIHVDKDLFQLVKDAKGKDKIVLITDSMRAGCMKDGAYDLGGQVAHVKDGAARLENGSLAGSVLTLNQGVRHFYENSDATFVDAIHMASLNPATSIKVADKKGSLEVGKDGDIIFLDESFACHFTMVRGEVVYERI